MGVGVGSGGTKEVEVDNELVLGQVERIGEVREGAKGRLGVEKLKTEDKAGMSKKKRYIQGLHEKQSGQKVIAEEVWNGQLKNLT